MGWVDGWLTGYRGPGVLSQGSCKKAHSSLQLQLLGIQWPLLASEGTRIHVSYTCNAQAYT